MKILLVNKFNFLQGGADKYFLDSAEWFKEQGHEVAKFCMTHPKNNSDKYEKYFVSYVDNRQPGIINKLRYAFRVIYSFEAKKKFEALIRDFKPDIIHYHNIYHQLSPSILSVAKKYKIPTVMHLHDYKLISANYNLFSNGHISFDGTAPYYYRCFTKKSFKNSYLKSLIVTIEMYLHHTILHSFEKNIDQYIASSYFMKKMCVRFGVPEKKIAVLYNFIVKKPGDISPPGDYLLYFGRLSPEKGVEVVLRGLSLSKTKPRLLIAGSGPLENNLKELADSLEVPVSFLGYLEQADLQVLIKGAGAIIIPSLWYENMPFVMLEAMSYGKIVIASRIGGTAEVIVDGENSLVFPTGDSHVLAEKIDSLKTIDSEMIARNAQKSVSHLTLEDNCKILMGIYQKMVKT
jgi:glycosyltransferase involved in cell wall biosynthesis